MMSSGSSGLFDKTSGMPDGAGCALLLSVFIGALSFLVYAISDIKFFFYIWIFCMLIWFTWVANCFLSLFIKKFSVSIVLSAVLVFGIAAWIAVYLK